MKCANFDTTSVGASLKMLDRIDGVVAAFATSPSCFSLYFMDPVKFRESMRDTRSRGPSAGKVGIATKACFIAEGKSLGDIRI
jgi:hypothetical protein